jgi:type I restriction enzyme S subunit
VPWCDLRLGEYLGGKVLDYGQCDGGSPQEWCHRDAILGVSFPRGIRHLQSDYRCRSASNYSNESRTAQYTFPDAVEEQQRIVGILDEAFEGIATAKANAEKNLHYARALFESHLQSVFTERGEGWVEKPLVSMCSLFVDSAHRTPKYQAEGIPALRPRDVVNGRLAMTEAARVSEEEYEIQSRRHQPGPGDIVYSRELSYGWAAMLPESPRVCLSQGMCLFRPTPDLDSAFLLYVLNGPVGREQATRAAVGAAHPHINLGDIRAYLIPLPSFSEQKQITRQLDAMAGEIQRLESLYQRKLAALEALKKSLLHQAFSGEL